jgi:hypothetical protein
MAEIGEARKSQQELTERNVTGQLSTITPRENRA